MGFSAFNYGANVVSFIKKEQKYGMVCAWAMQADYDKVLLLLGSQSVTGKNIQKGDRIGVSVLNETQKDLLDLLGTSHSDVTDKFAHVNYTVCDSAILIDEASHGMVVEVLEVLHLKHIEEDNLIYGLIKSIKTNEIKKLSLND